MICTTICHVWMWGGGGSYPGEMPAGLRCACGQYTRQSLDVMRQEIDALTADLAAATAREAALRSALAEVFDYAVRLEGASAPWFMSRRNARRPEGPTVTVEQVRALIAAAPPAEEA